MSNSMGLPPDIAEQMQSKAPGGIGSGLKENSVTAGQRQAAMNPTAAPPPQTQTAPRDAAPVEEEKVELCRNESCSMAVESPWRFCPSCGALQTRDPGELLGIKMDEKDLDDYLFKGYIVKDIKLLGSRTVTLKSTQTEDFEAMDDYIMNGNWGKHSDGTDRKVSDFYMRQMNAICMTAACVVKFNGDSIGETLPERVEWLKARGSGFTDLLSQKVNLYVQLITEFIRKEDNILGS